MVLRLLSHKQRKDPLTNHPREAVLQEVALLTNLPPAGALLINHHPVEEAPPEVAAVLPGAAVLLLPAPLMGLLHRPKESDKP